MSQREPTDEERFKSFFSRFGMTLVLMEAGPQQRTFEINPARGRFSGYSAVLKIFFNGDGKFARIEVQCD